MTERYLVERGCDEIFAVCRIGRATTDVSVRQVFELARRASLSSVGLVCTRSDVRALSYIPLCQYADSKQDIKEDEAARDWTGEKANTIKSLIQNKEECKRKMSELEAELASEDDSTDDENHLRRSARIRRNLRNQGYDAY